MVCAVGVGTYNLACLMRFFRGISCFQGSFFVQVSSETVQLVDFSIAALVIVLLFDRMLGLGLGLVERYCRLLKTHLCKELTQWHGLLFEIGMYHSLENRS